jgi:hypothetical protein
MATLTAALINLFARLGCATYRGYRCTAAIIALQTHFTGWLNAAFNFRYLLVRQRPSRDTYHHQTKGSGQFLQYCTIHR